MKNALIATGLVLAGFTMVPSAASAMCVGAGNICVDTAGNSGYQQYQPYGQQYGNRSNKQPQAITFPSYIPGNQYGSQQYQYGYQQYPYNSYGYQMPTYYYPSQYSYNQYDYSYGQYYQDYYEEYYGYDYGQTPGSTDCGYYQGVYHCY